LQTYNLPKELKEMESGLRQITKEKGLSIKLQDFERAAKFREDEERLTRLIDETKKDWRSAQEKMRPVITEEDVAYIVSKITGIPLFKLEEEESKRLLRMAEELHKRIVGQDEAVNVVATAIRRSRAGIKGTKRPIGSFIFLGPTGVGKTELAKALAEFLFNDENALIRLDMSEYMEKFSSSKLIGAPPGYVGYEEGGQLTEKVRRRPYSVVLFDEIEKAHPDIFNMLLQVLDNGSITDSYGRRVDFRNTVLIMTSNIGARLIDKGTSFGFQKASETDLFKKMKEDIGGELKRTFNPEFLNRLDDTVIFHPLNKKHLLKIVDKFIEELNAQLTEKGITLDVTQEVKKWLIKEGYQPSYGARPMRRVIQKNIGDKLSEKIIMGYFKDTRKIKVILKEDTPDFVEDEVMAGA
ncbi:MAG: ATP-dependent Clp protease ATP-binding subunit, partial [Nitrospirae bacterium]|nr:ATP-dependent Clp protease ATP-binding subunit [Nitrospirota bacterium]